MIKIDAKKDGKGNIIITEDSFEMLLACIDNVSGLCVVGLSKNLKLITTLDRDITQNPCYVSFFTNQ